MLPALLLLAAPLLSSANSPASPVLDGEPPAPPAEMVKTRALALDALRSPIPGNLSESDTVRALVRRAVAGAVALGDDSEAARALKVASREALTYLETQPRAAALLLRMVTEGAARDLAFTPLLEAALPAGFPYPAPAGEIQIAQYPQYRRAQAKMQAGRNNGAFFTLFRHITSNDIAMTAPVEMTVDQDRMVDMAFLYGDPEIGEAGEKGRVAVQDVAPMTVVSIGVRGASESGAAKEALKELEAWLERNGDQWQAAGNPRVMGYNSPMVPRARQFSEVQIPVVKRAES